MFFGRQVVKKVEEVPATDAIEKDTTVFFRCEQYLRMGFPEEMAGALAIDDHVDWHRVEDLLARVTARGDDDPYGLTYLIVS